MKLELPNDTKHCVILGKNGEGKTVAGIWQLSLRSYTTMPWVIVDFKRDILIGQIPYAQEIGFEYVPEYPGIYIIRPIPGQEDELETWLWKIYERENIGLFIDEGFMLAKSKAFPTLQMQGRSKHIPIITLSQRPVWLSRYVFSEAGVYQVFWMNDQRDRDTLNSFIPYDVNNRLPQYNSLWYDVGKDKLLRLLPAPSEDVILSTFERRLEPLQPKKRRI